jgi:hypothetical protein
MQRVEVVLQKHSESNSHNIAPRNHTRFLLSIILPKLSASFLSYMLNIIYAQAVPDAASRQNDDITKRRTLCLGGGKEYAFKSPLEGTGEAQSLPQKS